MVGGCSGMTQAHHPSMTLHLLLLGHSYHILIQPQQNGNRYKLLEQYHS
jgi:hypothetical protein